MEIKLKEIKIKNNVLINEKKLTFLKGINLIKAKNGSGKTLILKKIYEQIENYSKCFVEQNSNFILENASVYENICLSDNKEKINEVLNFLEKYNLLKIKNLNVNKLSGGEKRLIVLLRGFFNNSDIILIDEPTNDLDLKMKLLILEIINNLAKSKIIIIASHDDLFDQYSVQKINIRDHNIITDLDCKNLSNNLNKKTVSKKLFLKSLFFSKKISFNFFIIFFSLFLSFFLILLTNQLIKNNDYKNSDKLIISDNQINLYTLSTERCNHPEFSPYTMPCGYYNIFNLNDPLKALIEAKKQKKQLSKIKNSFINFPSNNTNFKFIPAYVSNGNKTINLLKEFLIFKGKDPNFTNIINDYFIFDPQSYIQYNDNIVFEFEEYNRFLNNFNLYNKNKITGAILLLEKGYSSNNFYNSHYYKNLNNNILIYSNLVKNNIQNLKNLNNNIKFLSYMSIIIFLMIMLNSGGIFLLIYLDRKKIIILKNNGFNLEKIINITSKKYIPKFLYQIFLFFYMLLLILFLTFINNKINSLLLYISILFFTIYIIYGYELNKLISKAYIKKIYNWRYRLL